MHPRLPLFIAAAGLLAAGALAWRSAQGTGAGEKTESAPEPRAATVAGRPGDSREEEADSFPRLLSGEGVAIAGEALRSLFTTRVGDPASLPVGAGITGIVTLVHRHATGDLAVGLSLSGYDDANAFFTLSPEGQLGGHLLSRKSGVAYRLDSTDGADVYLLKKVRTDELICAGYEKGRLLPGMPPEPEAAESSPEDDGGVAASVALLESLPGCPRVIYLNFEGETVSGTPWNSSFNGGAPIVAQPFPNPALIPEIWESICEDYAVFDVNVTTDRAVFENAAPEERIMAIFTPSKAWYGAAGGVAYLNSFGSGTNPYCWVFNITLNGAAESGSHEVGHTLGLRHDGTSSRVYYTGHTHASGVSWAPVMGTGYNRSVVQFSRGEYLNANRSEDDFEIMSGYLPYRPDDHGDSAATGTAVAADGNITNVGTIASADDSDWFRIESGTAGPFSVLATPHPRFRNLDIGLELLDENLVVVASSATEGPFDASIDLPNLPAGVHHLRLTGTGLGTPANGYSRYGSVGTYTLTGTYTAAPTPETPTALSASDGVSTDGVLLAWDPVATVDGYGLYRGLSPDAGSATLLASPTGTTHLDETAVAGTTYYYFVTAVKMSRESPRSPGEAGWRQFLPPASPADVTATDDSPHSIRVSWSAAERAQSYRILRHAMNQYAGAVEIGSTPLLSWHDTSTAPGDSWFYFVEAVNSGGISAPVGTATAGVKVPMPPGTPTGLEASDDLSTLLTLVTWNAAGGATGYRVYRHTIESVTGATEIAELPAVTTYEDTSGLPGVRYWYFVRAILAGGDSIPSNLEAGSREIAIPSLPTDLSATQGSNPAGVRLTWSSVPDASRYLVYRGSDASPGAAELLGETASSEWLDEAVAPGRTYRYFVQASNTVGSSDYTAAALGFGPEADPLDDEFENNDDFTLATPLTDPSIDATAVDGDPDWFEVTLDPGDTRLDLIVPYDAGKGSILLALHAADGSPVASFTAVAGARVLSHSGGAGLTYRVLVERDDGAAVPYQLIWRSLATGESGLEPDAKIGLSYPPAVGGDLRNANGAGQLLSLRLRPGATRRVYLTMTSRSAVAGTFRLFGGGGRKPFELNWDRLAGRQWKRVGATTMRKGIASHLEPLATSAYRVTVRRSPHDPGGRSRLSRFFTARGAIGSGPVDVAGLRLTARGRVRW